MANIELVIKIDEETYKKCKWKNNGVVGLEWWERAIANGTPLPKGHGRLVDEIIKTLEQEPYGKDINVRATDAISRQMAIDALGECPMVWMDSDAEITAERDWKDTIEVLKSLPSVIPQPKTDVLDKMRTEIEKQDEWLAQAGYTAYNVDIAFNSIKRVIAESEVEK